MCGKQNGRALIAQFEDGFFQEVGIDGVEATERLVEDEDFRLVDDGGDELDFLLHTFREFLDFLVPPASDFKLVEPCFQAFLCFDFLYAFEFSQINGLLPDFHFLVKAAFFGQVADAGDVLLAKFLAVNQHLTRVGGGDLVEDADEGGLARAVRTQKAVYATLWNLDAHTV